MPSCWFRAMDERDLAGEVEQGDVITGFVHLVSGGSGAWPTTEEDDQSLEVGLEAGLGIVLSQSCDMAHEQKMSKAEAVLVCRVYELEHYCQQTKNEFLKSAIGRESVRRGDNRAYHMISGGFQPVLPADRYVVSLREITVAPLSHVELIVSNSSRVARMKSPMREALAQAFARRFDRVAIDREFEIEPFVKPADNFGKAVAAVQQLTQDERTVLIDKFKGASEFNRKKEPGFEQRVANAGGVQNLLKPN